MNRSVPAVSAIVVLSVCAASAATLTVSKSGGGQFSSIQAAVDAAGRGDEIVITDTETYEGEVTIAKSGIVLRSDNVAASAKPVIRFTDTIHVGPRNYEESLIPDSITYYRNGALRIINADDVRIEGVVIDGGGVIPFGYPKVWENRYPFQHGNAALCVVTSGNVVIRNCDVRGAYCGCYIADLNNSGIYAIPNVADGVSDVLENRGPLSTGNHVIEYCRIHDNSYGLFFENTFDRGSTVRYNLIYENHHPDSATAQRVRDLTSDGASQSGGAFCFKNQLLSPLAICNNTLWHNSLPFAGNWKSGGIHLVYNNIIAQPDQYWDTSTTTFMTTFEMSKTFVNRMHATVYAAQQQAPTEDVVMVTGDLKPASADGPYSQGALIDPFPDEGEVRWLETKFLSFDPSSSDFLVPDWNDELVQLYIVDRGWEAAGVKDPDGSRADLGAIPMGGGTFDGIVTLTPAAPVVVIGDSALIRMRVNTRAGTMTDARITLFGLVRNLSTEDVFGSDYRPIMFTDILSVSLQSYDVDVGWTAAIKVPGSVFNGRYGFFEAVVEGVGQDSRLYPSAVGFLPYRKDEPYVKVDLMSIGKTESITRIRYGEPFTVIVSVENNPNGWLDSLRVDDVGVRTVSGRILLTPAGDTITGIPGGIEAGRAEFEALYAGDGREMWDNVVIYGPFVGGVEYAQFAGCTENLNVIPATGATFRKPVVSVSRGTVVAELIDLGGRLVYRTTGSLREIEGIRNSIKRVPAHGICLFRVTDRTSGRVVRKEMLLSLRR